jgi:hypothetical protein
MTPETSSADCPKYSATASHPADTAPEHEPVLAPRRSSRTADTSARSSRRPGPPTVRATAPGITKCWATVHATCRRWRRARHRPAGTTVKRPGGPGLRRDPGCPGSTTHRLPLIACIALLAACSDTGPSQTVKEQFGETTVCTAAILTATCRGPWAYQLFINPCYKELLDPACPAGPRPVPSGLPARRDRRPPLASECDLVVSGARAPFFQPIAGDGTLSR